MLKKIQSLCEAGAIVWTTHMFARIQERGILGKDVKNAIKTGEIIEYYPLDYPNPSCLIYGTTINGEIIHVVCGINDEKIFIITAYYPSTDKFENDLKTRKGEKL